ncbi:helix-turn-helix domain-containing protein [Streptomyces sp. NPDC054833]
MLSGRRYRLELSLEQVVRCEEFANVCRAVWNTGLEQRRDYRRRGAWMNYVPQAAQLADAIKTRTRVAEGCSLSHPSADVEGS